MKLKLPRKSLFFLVFLFLIAGTITEAKFTDIEHSSPLYFSTEYLTSAKILKGYPDETFRPKNEITRAEALKIIVAAIPNIVLDTGKTSPYKDVASTDWFTPYVEWAYKNKVIKSADNFFPARVVNRAEFLKMLIVSFSVAVEKNKFSLPLADVVVSDWFASYFQFFAVEKILVPDASQKVYPAALVKREEAAQWIFGFLKAGDVLSASALGTLTNNAITQTVSALLAGDIVLAEKYQKDSQYWNSLIENPSSKVEKLIVTLEASVKSYRFLSEKNNAEAIVYAKKAWSLASKIEDAELSATLQTLATGMANFAREK